MGRRVATGVLARSGCAAFPTKPCGGIISSEGSSTSVECWVKAPTFGAHPRSMIGL